MEKLSASAKKTDWTVLFAAAAWVLVLALGGSVDRALERKAAADRELQRQIAAETAFLDEVDGLAGRIREETEELLEARTDAVVERNRKSARFAVWADAARRAQMAAATRLAAPGADARPGGARPLIATRSGGNFQAGVYNGSTGAGKLFSCRASNGDVKAWIRIPGCGIDHPVLQSPAEDHYYCNRTWTGAASNRDNGCFWTTRTTRFGTGDSLSANSVIFGHNWDNCRWNSAPATYRAGMTQMEGLLSYHHTYWAEMYPYIYYSTPSEQMAFVIFACFYTEGGDWYIRPEPDVGSLVSEARARSRHTFGVDVGGGDRILTLSTCTRTYGNTENQRFVVMARLMRPGEEIGPVSVAYNPYHRQPNVWG